MKPSVLLTLLVLLFGAASASSQDIVWTNVTPGGFTDGVTEIDYAGGNVFYGVSPLALLKSTDGGEAWWVFPFSGMLGFDVEFRNENLGYVSGFAQSCGCGVIIKTSNGGQDWTPTTFPGIQVVTGIHFTDSLNGFASATNGAILKSTDAGETWSTFGPGNGSGMHFQNIFMASSSVGYATAMATGGVPNKLYKTTNGGTSWDKIMDNGADTMKAVYFGMYFTSPTVGYAAGRDAQRKIWKTTDGGTTWVAQFQMPGPLGTTLRDVKFLNDSVGFAVGDRGLLMRTINRGTAWFSETAPVPQTESLLALEFVTRERGFVGGTNGNLYMRTVTWQPTVRVSPASLDFGKMTTGTKELTFEITPGNEAGLSVNRLRLVDANGAGFEIVSPTTGFPKNIAPGAGLTVTVRFTPRAGLNARVFGSVEVETDDPRTPTKQVILMADATTGEPDFPELRISKSLIEFGQVRATLVKYDTVEIWTGNTKPLRLDTLYILGVGGPAHGLSIVAPTSGYPIMIPPDTTLYVVIRFAPTEALGEINAELVVKTDDPEDPEVRVTINADAAEPPLGVDDFIVPKELDLW